MALMAVPLTAVTKLVSGTAPISSDAAATIHGVVAAAPSAAEAEAAFRSARQNYMAVAAGTDAAVLGQPVLDDKTSDPIAGGEPRNIELQDVRVVMDIEDSSLRDVLAEVVKQVAKHTGSWTVKWRLRPENMDLMDERVNLTAEAPFGEFSSLLTERVKNMSGTQLYITAFEGARVILVTDTYY